jgi:hypothetical protein
MDRRNFLRNSAAVAIAGGLTSTVSAGAFPQPVGQVKKNNPALCLVYGQLNQTGNRIVEELAELERLGIPADIAVKMNYSPDIIALLNAWSEKGNLVAPSIYPHMIDPATPDANWHAYDEATCEKLLIKAKEMVLKAGFNRFDAIDTYTPGNGLVRAAKKLGIKYLTGFCGPELANDTHWKFNQTGAPLVPYFASDEDFRKPEKPTSDKWFQIANMELRSPLTCLEHWNEGPFCPLNLIMGDRTIEPGEEPVESMAAVTDWLEISRLTHTPRIIIVNLQYFTSLKCFDINRHFLQWLAEQRDNGRLRFVTLQEIANLNKEAGGFMPQTTWYRGETMGQMCGGQAGDGNPCIVKESMAGQFVWRDAFPGPERAYLYNRKWDYLPFNPSGETPESFGYNAEVNTKKNISENTTDIQLEWNAAKEGEVFLCAWDAFGGLKAPFKVIFDEGFVSVEAVPHPSGNGGALLFQARKNTGTGSVKAIHSGKVSTSLSQRLEGLITMETAFIRGRALTRMAPLVPYRFGFTLGIKKNKTSRWEAVIDGKVKSGMIYPGDKIGVILDGTRSATMVRLWDVTIDDITIDTDALKSEQVRLTNYVKKVASELAPASPPPILPPMLGALASIPEWAKEAAKRGADREIQLIEQARMQYAPGKPLASIHMAIDLPYGSRGRTRCGQYNRLETAENAEFFEYYYDYGQSYAPGVSGWNQFWQVSLGIRNHTPGKSYKLVLHTYDPESRGAQIRLLAVPASFDALVTHGEPKKLSEYIKLAQGLDSRFSKGAFITINLTPDLTSDESVVVHMRGNSEQVKYDRLTEGFGFVFLSHAWLLEQS